MAYNKRTSKRKNRKGGTKKKGSIMRHHIGKYVKNSKPVKITNGNIRNFVMVYLVKGKNSEDLPINLRGIPIGKWDVSNVTDMSKLFANTKMNEDISEWDVSNVTNMLGMFLSATIFDKPLNNWDVSSVTNMSAMFADTHEFNQSLDNWNVSKVTDMSSMFASAKKFNQPLNTWNVSNVKNFKAIFYECPIEQKNFENWEFNSSIPQIYWGFNILPEHMISGSDTLDAVYAKYKFMMTPEEKSILHDANIKLRNKYVPLRNKPRFFKARKEVLKLMDKLDEKYKTIDKQSTPKTPTPKTSAEKRHEQNLDILMYHDGPGRDLLEYVGPDKYEEEEK